MSVIGTSYAQALYDLACADGVEDRILQELTLLEKVFSEEPDFLRLLASPALSKDERCQVADKALLGRTHPYLCNTLKLMTEKGAVRSFDNFCSSYRALYDAAHGIIAVTAVTAVGLTAEQSKRLTDKLSAVTGKTVRICNRVDPACLGGVQLDYDGKQLDGTVRAKLWN